MSKVPKLRFPEFEGEWEEKELGDVGEFIGGGTPNTSIPEYWDGEISWYTPTEIKEDRYLLKESRRKITELGLKSSSAKLLPKGSLLITTRATIGDVAIVNEPCATNQGFQSLVVKENQINRFWFYWIIKNRELLIKKASGSTFKEIAKNEIIKIGTIVPQKKEQQKIADCLLSLDELIEARREKIASLKAYKKGLLQRLFPEEVSKSTPPPLIFSKLTKLRFEGFEGEWEEVKLGDVVKYENGKAFENNITEEGLFNVITLRSIDISGRLKDEHLKTNYNDNSLKKGDIVMVLSDVAHGDFLGLCAIIPTDDFVLNQRMGKLYKFKNVVNTFLYFYINNKQKEFKLLGQGSSQLNLSKQDILDVHFFLPSLDEQQKIADCLLSLDEKIVAETELVTQLQQHKKGLLQQLLV